LLLRRPELDLALNIWVLSLAMTGRNRKKVRTHVDELATLEKSMTTAYERPSAMASWRGVAA